MRFVVFIRIKIKGLQLKIQFNQAELVLFNFNEL